MYHDMFCACPPCIKQKGGASDVVKGQSGQSQNRNPKD